MTVKQRRSGIVGQKIEFDLLEPADHHDVLEHAGRRLPSHAGQLERVAMQVQRVDVVAGVPESEAVAPAAMQCEGRLLRG